MSDKIDLLNLTIEDLVKTLSTLGHKPYRAKQIFKWVHKGIKDIDQMTDFKKEVREQLKEIFYINKLEVKGKLVSESDETTKYLFQLMDNNIIESVLMEYHHGLSVCVSTQVGCKMGCKFCASTGLGFVRNLSASEIIDQVITIQNEVGKRISNVVLMGIGEPLDNYDNVIKFIRLVTHGDGLNIGARHITVSTSGLVPEIIKLSEEKMQVSLSISLNASNDTIREQIMIINKKYPIDKLIEACKIYIENTNRRITFEYALIEGLNDTEQNALEVSEKIKKMLCHVNLIPINSISDGVFKKSNKNNIQNFRCILESFGISTTIRRELGSDINAACGQLRRSFIKSI